MVLISKNVNHGISLEYFAGFFDGEGNVVIARNMCKKQAKSPQYNLQVSVSNSVRCVKQLFMDRFGGGIYGYNWQITGVAALNFLNLIYPYLTIKGKEVEIANKFMGLPRVRGRKGVPMELTILRERCLQEIKLLHWPGKGGGRRISKEIPSWLVGEIVPKWF